MAENPRRVWRPPVAHLDARGTITDLLVGERFDAASVITQRKGTVRGNHFHNETMQVLYLMRGKLRVVTQLPGGPVCTETAEPGDLIRTPPVERHAMVADDDSEFIVFTRGPRAGSDFESDTYRLPEPLVTLSDVDPR